MSSQSWYGALSILFFHLPWLLQPDELTSVLTCSQFPTNISYLTQTFPPGCCLCRCQYVIDINKVTLWGSCLLSARHVSQKLLTDPTPRRYRSRSEKERRKTEHRSLLGMLKLIYLSPSQQSTDWQAIQLSWSKKELTTIIISITSPSHPSLRWSFVLII